MRRNDLETALTIAGLDGFSIIICAHNSLPRLASTLQHVAELRVPQEICWEIVLVDNASTDGTSQAAAEIWRSFARAPIRVAMEPRMGLAYARACGMKAARYDVVSFVDDDNWVAPNWVETALDIMTGQPDIGACGGQSEAVFEVSMPSWFPQFQGGFAAGQQQSEIGDVSERRGYLWGAGLTVRRSAWISLLEAGFRPLLTGRKGTTLLSGDDNELCYALRLAGWRLWYDPRLTMRHYMPKTRLTFSYLRRLHRGFGASSAYLDPYYYAARYRNAAGFKGKLGRIWTWRVRETLAQLLSLRRKFAACVMPSNTDSDIPRIDYQFGRLRELLTLRGAYDANYDRILGAPWVRVAPPFSVA